MSNRKLSISELSILRQRAVEAVIKEGISQSKSAKLFGFTEASMSKYIKEYKLYGAESFNYKKRGFKPLTNRYLTEEQAQELIEIMLKKTPDEIGMEYSLWNSKVILKLIQTKYSVTYSERGIRQLMTSLGFSSQKPIKRAYQQAPDKIKKWLEEIYPAIKVRATQEGARIYWADVLMAN